LIGDHVAVTKFSYGIWLPFLDKELVDLGDPERGDVIVFRYPKNPSLNYIKRVVGIPGDKIGVQDNKVVLNGVTQPLVNKGEYDFVDDKCRTRVMRYYQEDLAGLKHIALTSMGAGGFLSNKREIEVPAQHVFVMGDNRDNSEDSRAWGFVRYDQIKGKAHVVWLSWDACNGSVGKVREDRFFHSLYE
jgi:signal peptidase I